MKRLEKKPSVSVVMAVYNGGKYIEETIESISSQTFGDFEFIIVNDGSTDDTQRDIEEYPDGRIRLINNSKNIGQTASLNIGLEKACGKYIARTDGGDISRRDRFQKQIEYLESHGDVDILGTGAFQYDKAGNFCRSVFLPNRASSIMEGIFFGVPVVHVSVMMRRDRILALGGYDESYKVLADYDLWARALLRGLRFWNLTDVLTGYLVDADSFGSSHSRGRSIKEGGRIICEIVLTLTGEHLSFDQAEHLYRFFAFGPHGLDSEWLQKTEALFEELLLKLHIPRRDIDYFLLRGYLKLLLGRCPTISSQRPELNGTFQRILEKWRGGLSFHSLEDLHSVIQSLLYRGFRAEWIPPCGFFNGAGKRR